MTSCRTLRAESLFSHVQNKENDHFLGPADLAGFLCNSENVKNLKSLYKIENSSGEWRVVIQYYLYSSLGHLRFYTLFYLQEDKIKYKV